MSSTPASKRVNVLPAMIYAFTVVLFVITLPLLLANATHPGSIPSYVLIGLSVAAVGYMILSAFMFKRFRR